LLTSHLALATILNLHNQTIQAFISLAYSAWNSKEGNDSKEEKDNAIGETKELLGNMIRDGVEVRFDFLLNIESER
jgi:hypothetical protein